MSPGKDPAALATPRGRSSTSNGPIGPTPNLIAQPSSAQGQSGPAPARVNSDVLPASGIMIANFWRSPRGRHESVQVTLRTWRDYPYVDFRVYELDGDGRMQRTERGIAIGLKVLPKFHRAIGDALARAKALGLLTEVSS